MIFFYTRYELVLAEKQVRGSLKKSEQIEDFDLKIITTGIRFLGLPLGGGLIKLSRLYKQNGELVHARYYSPEIKAEVKQLKAVSKIPYLKLWVGYLILVGLAVIGSVLYGIKMNADNQAYQSGIDDARTALAQPQVGQLYGVNLYADDQGNSIQGLPGAWIRVEAVQGDTLFVRRSVAQLDNPLAKKEDFEQIKPTQESDWNAQVEKINYSILKDQLTEQERRQFDLMYIGEQRDDFSGVVMSVQWTE